ncbi:maleylacetoacetate isomerase [Congregibacter litoralis]|uniref:Maleylacetoacetate isomerase n=1 Tax=Congregibacter litoralis KT71 TaxID=314285 RepID=A4A637_9GAMM|nr:maleylacetoacetate isomerase [Congregibacter litoralis]EAQ98484.1 maleylacetoacetate isomerase [Congregibacter litoralis KT71]
MKLYSFFRSTAAYRVRIALGLKKLEHEIAPVDLIAGQQRSATFLGENPQGLVPALVLDSGKTLAQSGAILEWLEETHPDPPLYPEGALARAQTRALCQHIACDIHPLNNLRVLRYLNDPLELEQSAVDDWYAHWIHRGFTPLEKAVGEFPEAFSLGDRPGMLEIFLIPQVFNAYRFKVDLTAFPNIAALDKRCQQLTAFHHAHPSRQVDTPQEERA